MSGKMHSDSPRKYDLFNISLVADVNAVNLSLNL